ncbi:MAG: hypothetical protein R3D71_02595 [Rickettsiales bacterium]
MAAELMWQGKSLYKDIWEINTPLIFYISMIPVSIHHLTNIPVIPLFFLLICAMGYASIWFSWSVLKKLPIYDTQIQANTMLMVLYCIGFIVPAITSNFGQREHIFVLGILPYISLLIAYSYQRTLPVGFRVMVGVVAAIAFSIKPYFIIVFAAAELAMLHIMRGFKSIMRIEPWIIGLGFVIYHVVIAAIFSEYLQEAGIAFVKNYSGYKSSLELMIAGSILFIAPTIFMVGIITKTPSYNTNVAVLLVTLIFSSLLLYLIPLTDYYYHLLPMISLQIFLWTVLLLKKARYVWVFLLLSMLYYKAPVNLERERTIKALSESIQTYISAGDPIAFLDSLTAPSFPVTNYSGGVWALSLPYMAQIPSAYMDFRGTNKEPIYHTIEEMTDEERLFTERTIQDLEELPVLIIINYNEKKSGLPQMKFDILKYLMGYERFRELWKNYRHVEDVEGFSIYKKIS